MVVHKTIEDFFKRKRTIRNKNLIIKIEKDVYGIKEPTSKEWIEYHGNNMSQCEHFCDFYEECIQYSKEECKLHRNLFFSKLSEIEALMLSNKK